MTKMAKVYIIKVEYNKLQSQRSRAKASSSFKAQTDGKVGWNKGKERRTRVSGRL